MLADSPFRDIAVGVTAMVGEATDTAAFCSVNELLAMNGWEIDQ
jgi:hypothetical protein